MEVAPQPLLTSELIGGSHSSIKRACVDFAAIDMLIYAYKQLLPKMGGYLSDAGRINLARTEILMRAIASQENEVFERRRRRDEGRERQQVRCAACAKKRGEGMGDQARASLCQAARAMAEGGTVPTNVFGSLYPPRDQTQRQLLQQIKAFAESEDLNATISIPTSTSGSPPLLPTAAQ